LAALGYKHIVQQVDSAILSDKRMNYENNQALRLRHAASDTVGGSSQYFGDIKPTRKPSPLKMKVAILSGSSVLLLTGLSAADMTAAHGKLRGHPLGDVAWNAV
jgi:hypothetical protein